jgi:AcrR family transcriptional regulator
MALLSTRERILDAAAHVMGTSGLASATTREIARAAGFSEAALYKHFRDKEELFLSVLSERLPPLMSLLDELPKRAGRGTVAANLEEVARAALAFYDHSVPMAAALFSDPVLLAHHRQRLSESGAGPQRPFEVIAAYLKAEQQLGRLSRGAKPPVGAGLLLGACFQRAFVRSFLGEQAPRAADEVFARDAVRALLRGLTPAPVRARPQADG